ncbi:RNA polymerase sigma-70 factor [Halosquirtibacter laminarini]|uniref:RNA polymerase sigma-70 factor n=1 Tax=Halosquirtibacter laminarini TaxID=3374600 RepID=A0AC61NI07_9BACT|nr:RNA polymerase sigma-70 factor [Prolixibacteraceae bacterium]
MNDNLEHIIISLNRKDRGAFNDVFELLYPRLLGFANEYIDIDDAKNIVQDAFVTLWNKNPHFNNKFQLQSYLYTIVKNSSLYLIRKNKIRLKYRDREEKLFQTNIHIDALKNLDTTSITFKEINNIINDTVNNLPDRCRDIFLLSRESGLKNREIAEDLDISIKTVEANITKALKILSKELVDYLLLVSVFLLNR